MKKKQGFKKRNFVNLIGVDVLQEENNQSFKLSVVVRKRILNEVQRLKFLYITDLFLNNLENIFKKSESNFEAAQQTEGNNMSITKPAYNKDGSFKEMPDGKGIEVTSRDQVAPKMKDPAKLHVESKSIDSKRERKAARDMGLV